MSPIKDLEEVIKERLDLKHLEKDSNFAGGAGCIGKCYKYTMDHDEKQSIFVKTSSSVHSSVMFEGEFESLKQIRATNTISAPKPLLVAHNYDKNYSASIVMEFLNLKPLDEISAKKLGQELASLHDYNNKFIRFKKKASGWVGKKIPSVKQCDNYNSEDQSDDESSDHSDGQVQISKHFIKTKSQPASKTEDQQSYPDRFVPKENTDEISKYGFDVPTSCGSIPQVNEWTDDWVSFYARHRLDVTIRELLSRHSDRELDRLWSQFQLKIGKYFCDFARDEKIVPALLHGDLWSGNVAQLDCGGPVVYDPASFYGHNEYEFGLVKMFGGFPKIFEDAYFDEMPQKKLFHKRSKLYQLFHHLNHWNHFGSGYRASSLRILTDLNSH